MNRNPLNLLIPLGFSFPPGFILYIRTMRILYLLLFSLAQAFIVNTAIASPSVSEKHEGQSVYHTTTIASSDSRIFNQGEQQFRIQHNLLSHKTDSHRQASGSVSVIAIEFRKGIFGIRSTQSINNTSRQNFLRLLLFPNHHFW